MEGFSVGYRVERRSRYSKKFVVVKCLVNPSSFGRGGHESPIDVVSVPLDRDDAYSFCARLNEEERAKENPR